MKRFIIFTLVCISYMKLREEKLQSASNIDSFIDLYFIDEEGVNVFDPKYQGLNNLEILVLKGKRFIKFYDPRLYASKGYVINSDFSIRLFLNLPPVNKDYSYTYIRFNNNKIITIKTEFSISSPKPNDPTYGGGSIIKRKIWFNTNLIWESTTNTIIVPSVNITFF